MSLISGITDAVGLTDSGAGAEAAAEAGRISELHTREGLAQLAPQYNLSQQQLTQGSQQAQQAIFQGMQGQQGFLQQGGDQAMASLLSGNQQAGQFLGQGRDAAVGRLDPLASTGMDALNRLQYGSTAEGYASNLNDLMSGGALAPLIAQNRGNLQAELAAQGLTRSGSGLNEMSQIPLNTVMGIENQLQGRTSQVANYGLPAITNIAQLESGYGQGMSGLAGQYGANLANLQTGLSQNQAGVYGQGMDTVSRLREAYGNNLANSTMGYGNTLLNANRDIGAAQSSALLGGAQAEAADRSALTSMAGTGAGAYAALS